MTRQFNYTTQEYEDNNNNNNMEARSPEDYTNVDGETFQDGVKTFADSWEDETTVYPGGGKSSKLDTRYDLLPPLAVNEVARVLALGCVKYGEWNWVSLPIRDNLNHALRHCVAQNIPSMECDERVMHASHAACRALFVLEQLLLTRIEGGTNNPEDDDDEF